MLSCQCILGSEVGSPTSTKKRQERWNMKFILFFEWDPKDGEKIVARRKKLRAWYDSLSKAEREERAKRHTSLFPSHWIGGESKGFEVVDTDDPTLLAEWVAMYYPELKFKFAPIFPQKEIFEQFQDVRKKVGL
jgi:hypothetical protein